MAASKMTSLFVVSLFGSAPQVAVGDLGAAVRRSSMDSMAVLPSSAPLRGSVVLPLVREGARHHDNAEEVSFYVGEISVGHPAQPLRVIFDTSSGNLMLPHRACSNTTCLEHHRYSPWQSSTAMDVQVSGRPVQPGLRLARGKVRRDGVQLGFTQSDLGEGDVEGVSVRDSVCVGEGAPEEQACVDVAIVAAYKMEDKPFRYMPNDGIVGLGLPGAAAGPLTSFFGRLLEGSTGVLPQFGLALGTARGELHLGGHDTARLAAPLRWFPVDHPEAGLWQVAIQSVRVGDRTVDDCKRGCHGIVDSSVSRLGVQANRAAALQTALKTSGQDVQSCQGPDLSFDLGGMTLTLRAEDYVGRDCVPLVGSLNITEPEFVGVYTFGVPLLRRYYAAFDWEQRKLGFAPQAEDETKKARTQALPDDLAGSLYVF